MGFIECRKVKNLNVKINNKEYSIQAGMNILKLLETRQFRKNSSVWVNGRQLLLKEYADYLIEENDEIKILQIIAGG